MIVNMSEKATEQEIKHVIERIREAGYQPHVTRGTERTIVAAVGSGRRHEIEALAGRSRESTMSSPSPSLSNWSAARSSPERSIVKINGVAIGGPEVVVIAGPCSVESREQLLDTAHAVKRRARHVARRRLQAAHLALRLSGLGPRSAQDFARSASRKLVCRS